MVRVVLGLMQSKRENENVAIFVAGFVSFATGYGSPPPFLGSVAPVQYAEFD